MLGLKVLFPGSTDFTVAISKIRQISKHFSTILGNNSHMAKSRTLCNDNRLEGV